MKKIVRLRSLQVFFVLIVYCLLPTAYLFSQGTWTQKANFPGGARAFSVGFSIGSKGYVGIGSAGSNGNYKDFWEYDPAIDMWTQKADFPDSARWYAIGFSANNLGYVGTGEPELKDIWEFNPITNTWIQKNDFGGGLRQSAVSFVIGNKAYVGTGYYQGEKNDFWEYNPATDTWTQKANLTGSPRQFAIGFSIGGNGYIGTGDYGACLNDFWEYDTTNNSWSPKANFQGGHRYYAVAFSLNGLGYVGTGTDCISAAINDLWAYDPLTDMWIQQPTPSTSYQRFSGVAFSIGNKGYIGLGGGYMPNSYFNDFWEFSPTAGINEAGGKNISSCVFPNPTKGKINVQMRGFENVQMKIYNLFGECIHQEIYTSAHPQIDLSSQPSGVYFINIISGNENTTKRIVISH